MKTDFLKILFVILWAFGLGANEAVEPVQLLPHQKYPIEYLMSHPEQKGLLIYHAMGSGKTYLAIGMAEKYPDKKIVIITPRFLLATWRYHLKTFPAKNLQRYQLVGLDEAPHLLDKSNLEDAIVIIDEAHRFVERVRSVTSTIRHQYSDLYLKIRHSFRILALTGTPIYMDESDVAYLLNLVSGKDLLPFNDEDFRIQYMTIDKTRSTFRGHFTESALLRISLPIVGGLIATGLTSVFMVPFLVSASLSVIPTIINQFAYPLPGYNLRHFDALKLRTIALQYISYFGSTSVDGPDYASKTLYTKDIYYNEEQLRYFFEFAEMALSVEQLKRVLPVEYSHYKDEFLALNSSTFQAQIKNQLGSGREIGNLAFTDQRGDTVESPKFQEMLKVIKSQEVQTVVYSNYFERGILLFAKYLDQQGYKGRYAVLDPSGKFEDQMRVLEDYNTGKTQILLLHPDITEGISLRNTRQFHIMEPLLSEASLEQIIARAIRYHSHAELLAEERHVDVYLWNCPINSAQLKSFLIKQDNYLKRHSELNYWANFGWGQIQVNRNFERERFSPDTAAINKKNELLESMNDFNGLVVEASIENKID